MPENRPNIIVVICHDLGQQLGCYGTSYIRSPHIDAFAESGIRFKNSFSVAPQCCPSRAALWTGRFPHANGVVGLTHAGFANDLHPNEKHLAQILRLNGYDTHLFGVQNEARAPERCGHAHIHEGGPCGQVAQEFAKFVTGRDGADDPLFAQIGFFEPHRPFPHHDVTLLPAEEVTPPPYLPDIPEVREDLREMEASIHSADEAFGTIVESVRSSRMSENTLIVFTADHGIPFPHAKMTLYDPGIQVPLLLSGPGMPSRVVCDEMVSNVDILPTLLDLVGVPSAPNLHGRSFSGLLKQGEYIANEQIFAEKTYHVYYDPMRAVRTTRWKLIANFECAPWQETTPDYFGDARGYVEVSKALDLPSSRQYHPPYELYDLERDPHELSDLADDPDYRATRDQLAAALCKWMEDTEDPLLHGPMAQGAYRERMKEFRRIRQPRDFS